jgi:hypothetical protein
MNVYLEHYAVKTPLIIILLRHKDKRKCNILNELL